MIFLIVIIQFAGAIVIARSLCYGIARPSQVILPKAARRFWRVAAITGMAAAATFIVLATFGPNVSAAADERRAPTIPATPASVLPPKPSHSGVAESSPSHASTVAYQSEASDPIKRGSALDAQGRSTASGKTYADQVGESDRCLAQPRRFGCGETHCARKPPAPLLTLECPLVPVTPLPSDPDHTEPRPDHQRPDPPYMCARTGGDTPCTERPRICPLAGGDHRSCRPPIIPDDPRCLLTDVECPNRDTPGDPSPRPCPVSYGLSTECPGMPTPITDRCGPWSSPLCERLPERDSPDIPDVTPSWADSTADPPEHSEWNDESSEGIEEPQPSPKPMPDESTGEGNSDPTERPEFSIPDNPCGPLGRCFQGTEPQSDDASRSSNDEDTPYHGADNPSDDPSSPESPAHRAHSADSSSLPDTADRHFSASLIGVPR